MSSAADSKNFIDITDPLKIVVLSIFTNFFAEFLTWMFIYRTKKYKENKRQMDRVSKNLELTKESTKGKRKQIDKKIKQQENELKYMGFEMMKIKFISMIIIGLFTFFFISLFNGLFQGIVVAKIPFVPFKLLRRLSHRNILSNDYTDCSFVFLYLLCNISFRPIIQKMLGFAPPRTSNKMPDFFGLEENK